MPVAKMGVIFFTLVENPCSSNPCDENACCDDSLGEVSCDCYTGYTGNGITCTGDVTDGFSLTDLSIWQNSPSSATPKMDLSFYSRH